MDAVPHYGLNRVSAAAGNIPFGTALGRYSLWVLLPAESERQYEVLARAESHA
jgi:hypothetical protein